MSSCMSRRHLIHLTAMVAAVTPLASLLPRPVRAADAPLLSPSDPAAAALNYVEDATRAKTAKPGSKCSTCALFQATAGAAQGPCAAFGGKQVKAAGWCSAWSPKA